MSTDLPEPTTIEALIAALTDAARDLARARQELGERHAASVNGVRTRADRRHQELVAMMDGLSAQVTISLEAARAELSAGVTRADTLVGSLSSALLEVEAARARLQADLGAREREIAELRRALAAERTRVGSLEERLEALAASHEELHERVVLFENRRWFRF